MCFLAHPPMAPHHPQPTIPVQAFGIYIDENYLKWWAIQLATH